MPDACWERYVAEYHDANPGITEDVLIGARDGDGRSPYEWIADAVPAGTATIVDVACGSGPVARRLPGSRVVGVDRSAAELSRGSGLRVRCDALALPLAGGSVGAVVSSMALMLLRPLEAVLAEAARVLRSGGAFVATVPSRAVSAGAPAFTEILRTLDQVGLGYPEPLPADGLAERFAASGLTLVADETAVFDRPVTGREDAALIVRSFYAPGAAAGRVAAAVERFQEAAPEEVSYRVRRLVAVRSIGERPGDLRSRYGVAETGGSARHQRGHPHGAGGVLGE